jgi:hypothetical protein
MPARASLKCSSRNRCHHLVKTFCGWQEKQLAAGRGIVERPRLRLRWIAAGQKSNSGADAPPALGVPVGPRPSGQATNGRALPDPLECEFDFVNGVINILLHQHSINIAGQK